MGREANPETKEKLLEAAEELMLRQGFTGTSVEEICQAAGVTKGGFFHYFESKHQLAQEAVRRFYGKQAGMFRDAAFQQLKDPLERIYGYLDFLAELSKKPGASRGCLVGTLTQELAVSDKEMRCVVSECLSNHAEALRRDLAAAKGERCPRAKWNAQSLAEHCVATLQGTLILVKAHGEARLLAENAGHVKRYLQLLFEGGEG